MAIKFNNANGSAKKGKVDYYNPSMGENRIRLVGELLPRYVYWVKGGDREIPVENLSFDREKERFTNEVDPVKEMFPELKSQYAYAVQVYDYTDRKVKVWSIKRTVLEALIKIINNPKNPLYGVDPSSLTDGFDIIFTKEKTGPKQYNVEYTLETFSMLETRGEAPQELLDMMESVPSIESIYPKPSAEDVRESLNKILNFGKEEKEEADQEAVAELED